MADAGRGKRPTMRGKGREIFFERQDAQTLNPQTVKRPKHATPLERSTFYVHPEHHEQLDGLKTRLRSRLRKEGFKRSHVDKSELVRMAIDMLLRESEDELLGRLTSQALESG